MMMRLIPLLLAPLSVLAQPATPQSVRQIYQFDNSTFIENIAARSNGELLLTTLSNAFLYRIDPTVRDPSPEVLHEFPDANSLSGITEMAPDIFAVITGVINRTTFSAEKASLTVWTVDLNPSEPVVTKIATNPTSTSFNGMTTLRSASGVLLISDSIRGAVWRLDVHTREFSIVVEDPLLGAGNAQVPLGINGIHTLDQMLYFANSGRGLYGRMPLTDDACAAGDIEILARLRPQNQRGYDDFALDHKGNAWVATHPNEVNLITARGKQRVFAGGENETEFAEPTSAAFGRGTRKESRTLYMTTGGTTLADGEVFGGQLVAIKL